MSVGLPTNSPPPSPAGLPLVTQSSAAIATTSARTAVMECEPLRLVAPRIAVAAHVLKHSLQLGQPLLGLGGTLLRRCEGRCLRNMSGAGIRSILAPALR
jgi:hypothetical protein